MHTEFRGQAKLDPLGESFQDLDSVGRVGCVAGLELRTSPPMTNTRKPKRPTKYSRANGSPLEPVSDVPLAWDGGVEGAKNQRIVSCNGVSVIQSCIFNDFEYPRNHDFITIRLWTPKLSSTTSLEMIVLAHLAYGDIESVHDQDMTWSTDGSLALFRPSVEMHRRYRLESGYVRTRFIKSTGEVFVALGYPNEGDAFRCVMNPDDEPVAQRLLLTDAYHLALPPAVVLQKMISIFSESLAEFVGVDCQAVDLPSRIESALHDPSWWSLRDLLEIVRRASGR
jgi:hypothetical protein